MSSAPFVRIVVFKWVPRVTVGYGRAHIAAGHKIETIDRLPAETIGELHAYANVDDGRAERRGAVETLVCPCDCGDTELTPSARNARSDAFKS